MKDRPAHFDEERSPIGQFQAPVVKAAPTELQAEDALTFTLRITANGPVLRPPPRLRLEDFPGFKESFEIDDLDDGDGRVDERTWEFTHRLRPRNETVKAIPSFPFVYFVPGLLPAHRGYQTRHTSPIELTVKPRTEVRDRLPGSRAPESVYQFHDGTALWRRGQGRALPTLPVLAHLLFAPPLLCVAWYMAWRFLYPDAAQRARQRRSRAAQRALQSLHALDRSDPPGHLVVILADYLRHRFDLSAAEPTPEETAAHLQHRGVAAHLAAGIADFLRRCDAARFAPAAPIDEAELAAGAEQLILALEAPPQTDVHHMTPKAGSLVVVGLLGLASSTLALGVEPGKALLQARASFEEGLRLQDDSPREARRSFQEAAESYDALCRQWYPDYPAFYQNQGNAWLLSGDVARAIFCYCRGLELDPNDPAMQECLAYARDQVNPSSPDGFGRPPIDHRPPWLPRLAPLWLLGTAVVFYSLTCASITRWWMTRRGALLLTGGGSLLITVVLGGFLVVEDMQRRYESRYPLVVIADDGVLLYKGNGPSYPRFEAPLNAGVEARLLFQRGDWLQIQLSGGEVGWVPQNYALVASDR